MINNVAPQVSVDIPLYGERFEQDTSGCIHYVSSALRKDMHGQCI